MLMGLSDVSSAVVAAASVWGDSGTNITLSQTTLANDTATGATNAFTSVRGTQAYSAGKKVFQVKILVAPAVPNFIIGLMDNTTANGAAMDDRLLVNSAGHSIFNGSSQAGGTWNGTNIGSGWSLSTNDVMTVAADLDNEFYYLASNHTGSLVWFLSGDPTSGALGTGAVGSGGRPGARPMLSLWGTPVNSGTMQLLTGSNVNPADIPSLYSAWA